MRGNSICNQLLGRVHLKSKPIEYLQNSKISYATSYKYPRSKEYSHPQIEHALLKLFKIHSMLSAASD